MVLRGLKGDGKTQKVPKIRRKENNFSSRVTGYGRLDRITNSGPGNSPQSWKNSGNKKKHQAYSCTRDLRVSAVVRAQMFPENITALYGVDKFNLDILIIGPLSCLDHRCINFFPSLSKKEFSCQKATALDYSFRFLFTQQISKKYTHIHTRIESYPFQLFRNVSIYLL